MSVVLSIAIAAAAAGSIGTHDPARAIIMTAARGPAQFDVGKPVRLLVKTLKRQSGWVFLLANMQDLHGHPIDLTHSKLAKAASEGMASDTYAALLHHTGDGWTVIVHATGPTDVAWQDWASQYGAPTTLITRSDYSARRESSTTSFLGVF